MLREVIKAMLGDRVYYFFRNMYGVRLLGNLLGNIDRKMWFGHFYMNRKKIRNWLELYVYCSSLAVDIFFAFYRKRQNGGTLKIQAVYSDPMVLFFPAMTSRYYGMFTNMVADQYIGDFMRYYQQELSFKNGDVIIDVGAHVGKFSIPMALRYPEAHIYAFEPDPDNFDCLRMNFESNFIKAGRYTLYHGAVADHEEDLFFSVGRYSTQGSVKKVGFNYESLGAPVIKVRSFTLEGLFREKNIDRCALLKMDCEGGEYLIFGSLPAEFFRRIDVILIEVHLVKDMRPLMLKEVFEKNGFIVKGHERPDGAWEMFCMNSARREG